MHCPVCNHDPASAPCCERCGVSIRIEGGHAVAAFAPITPGRSFRSYDLTRDAPPGHRSHEHHVHGHTSWRITSQGLETWHTRSSWAYTWVPSEPCSPDHCVSATAVVLHDSGEFAVVARRASLGDTELQYALVARPARGGVRIERQASSPREAASTLITDWCAVPSVAIGAPIHIELRVRGATLEARANGAVIALVHDPVLGTGGPGLVVAANHAPPQTCPVRCLSFDVREVAP